MSETPVAVSPLITPGTGLVVDGWEGPAPSRSLGEVTVVDLCSWAKVQVRGEDDQGPAPGVPFGRAERGDGRWVLGSGPGEWMVLAAPGSGPALVSALVEEARGSFVSVVDQTHGRALVRISGRGTRTLLRRLAAMDLDDRFVPEGAVLRTTVASVVTDLVRDDDQFGASYLLHCERSSGRYLTECILAAGADLGAVLSGEASPGETLMSAVRLA